MNKSQLIEKIADQTKMTKVQCEMHLDTMIRIIEDSVAKGDDVKIVGFGTFSKVRRKSRQGRNPKTGEALTIPGLNMPKFRPGKEFKFKLN